MIKMKNNEAKTIPASNKGDLHSIPKQSSLFSIRNVEGFSMAA